ncbi:MAG: fadD5 [Aeromicrobium sp.]|nr:fadD5 [Aeromicrobium sp.]
MGIDVNNLVGRRADNRWDRVSVSDMVERLTWSTPERNALVGWAGAFADDRFARLTYRQLDDLVNQIANGLLARGLQRGDRVAMVCENSVEGYAFKLGVARAGLVVAPMNPAMAPDVVAHLIERIEPKFAVVDAELWPGVEGAFVATGLDVDVTIQIGGGAVGSSIGFADFVTGQDASEPEVAIHGDDIWEILFTSGTTAMPKAVMLSHSSSMFAAYGFALTLTRGLRREGDLRLGTFLPMMYHIGHNIFALAAFACGGTIVIGRRPDPAVIAEATERESLTALWCGSPAMVEGLLKAATADTRDISSLTVGVFGWASVAPAVRNGLRAVAPSLDLVEIFGQTESISCHRFWLDEWDELYLATAPQQNYVGLPSPLLASRVVDAEGKSLEGQVGIAGEAVYRSPVMASGYYRDEEATRQAFRDGWFHSGDSCVYDERGLRIMVDRFKDIVKSGGENVSTIRVETVLAMHPGVVKAAVIGVPHDKWGEEVTAIVVLVEPDTVVEAELIAFARERLAGFETPKSIVFVEALPETVGGKVMKYKLREQFA